MVCSFAYLGKISEVYPVADSDLYNCHWDFLGHFGTYLGLSVGTGICLDPFVDIGPYSDHYAGFYLAPYSNFDCYSDCYTNCYTDSYFLAELGQSLLMCPFSWQL